MEAKQISELTRFQMDKMSKINLFQTEHFFCDIYCLAPSQSQRLHSHNDADKIYFVLEGRGNFQIGTEEAEFDAGHCLLARAGLPHGVENRSTEQLVLLVFMAPNPNFTAKH